MRTRRPGRRAPRAGEGSRREHATAPAVLEQTRTPCVDVTPAAVMATVWDDHGTRDVGAAKPRHRAATPRQLAVVHARRDRSWLASGGSVEACAWAAVEACRLL